MTASAHAHDVNIIWEFWPLNVALPQIVRVLLTGYGVNPIFTWMYDISFWPIFLWNSFFGLIGVPINIVFNFLYAVINGPTAFVVAIWEYVKFFLMTFRNITGWSNVESFVAVASLTGVTLWLAIESGLFGEMPADGTAAGGDAAATA